MIGEIVRQVLGDLLLRVRMEARKAGFAAAALVLAALALALAGAAGLVALAERFGLIAGLLGAAGLIFLLALIVYFVGRRLPGADATRREVEAAAVIEDVPVPGVPHPEAHSTTAAFAHLHDTVRARIDGVVPPGSQGMLTTLAAQQLSRRPVPTLAAALAVGAAIGFVRMRKDAGADSGDPLGVQDTPVEARTAAAADSRPTAPADRRPRSAEPARRARRRTRAEDRRRADL